MTGVALLNLFLALLALALWLALAGTWLVGKLQMGIASLACVRVGRLSVYAVAYRGLGGRQASGLVLKMEVG